MCPGQTFVITWGRSENCLKRGCECWSGWCVSGRAAAEASLRDGRYTVGLLVLFSDDASCWIRFWSDLPCRKMVGMSARVLFVRGLLWPIVWVASSGRDGAVFGRWRRREVRRKIRDTSGEFPGRFRGFRGIAMDFREAWALGAFSRSVFGVVKALREKL